MMGEVETPKAKKATGGKQKARASQKTPAQHGADDNLVLNEDEEEAIAAETPTRHKRRASEALQQEMSIKKVKNEEIETDEQ